MFDTSSFWGGPSYTVGKPSFKIVLQPRTFYIIVNMGNNGFRFRTFSRRKRFYCGQRLKIVYIRPNWHWSLCTETKTLIRLWSEISVTEALNNQLKCHIMLIIWRIVKDKLFDYVKYNSYLEFPVQLSFEACKWCLWRYMLHPCCIRLIFMKLILLL